MGIISVVGRCRSACEGNLRGTGVGREMYAGQNVRHGNEFWFYAVRVLAGGEGGSGGKGWDGGA